VRFLSEPVDWLNVFASLLQSVGTPPADALVVFAIIAVALVFFLWEPVPIDVTAIGVLVALIVLEPWTQIDPETGIGGFASPATVTVLAMFILSEGVRRSGLVNIIGAGIADRFGDSPLKQLVAVLGLSGGSAGFVNNTPVVAIMIPMVNQISNKTGISPSKLLLPVSYVAMLGGMLTLIGTSTNILASDLSGRLLGQSFSMFEFTQLGVIVLLTGTVYLVTVGRHLIPERIAVTDGFLDEFEMAEYLTEVIVEPESGMVGNTAQEILAELDLDADIVQLIRRKRALSEPIDRRQLQAGDVMMLRADQETLFQLIEAEGLGLAPDAEEPISEDQLDETVDGTTPPIETGSTAAERTSENDVDPEEQRLVEVVLSPEASIIGKTLETLSFRQRYDATVLAIRRGGKVIHVRMDKRRLRPGDTLLIQASEQTVTRFSNDRDFILARELTRPDFRTERIPVALGIIAGVVALAALDILPIVVSALGGIVATVLTGCVKPEEMYDAVDWSVVFLLAGLIPLGVAMERTGGAAWLADGIVAASGGLHPVLVLGIFYLFTALITNVISNNASVVLMIPVAIDTAQAIGAEPFSFVLSVTFAASTALMTPIGYQTNLMVYGPGGYKFGDFVRVGAPLQLILTVVTTLGIVFFFGI